MPELPLQILLVREPSWRGEPAAVVAEDRPQGRVLWANAEARRCRVLPGLRYADALGLAAGLRAGVVAPEESDRAVTALAERLRAFTPHVEPLRDDPGVFFLDASGLERLHPDLAAWAESIRADLAAAGFRAAVAVGFTRFGTFAAARVMSSRGLSSGEPASPSPSTAEVGPERRIREQPVADNPAEAGAPDAVRRIPAGGDVAIAQTAGLHRRAPGVPPPRGSFSSSPLADTARSAPSTAAATGGASSALAGSSPHPRAARQSRAAVFVFPSADAESAALRRVPLERVGLPPEARDLLAKLGVATVGAFLSLPPGGVSARLGSEALRLHRMASGDERPPLLPETPPDPLALSVLLEHPEAEAERLLFLVKRMADRLLARAADRRLAASAVSLRLLLDDGSRREDVLRTAHPTLDAAQVMDLVRLRLAATALPSGAVEVSVALATAAATEEQLRLFEQKPRRDLAAAGRALARIRADLGDDAVVRASLREGHLPEAAFAWEPVFATTLPRPVPAPTRVPLSHARSPHAPSSLAPSSHDPSLHEPPSHDPPSREPSSQPPPEGRPPPPLVRRILSAPVALPPRPRHEPDGWMLNGFEHGPVVKFQGPFVTAGGWWTGAEVRREYHFAETARGHVFWIYYDVRRRRWFLQGEVS